MNGTFGFSSTFVTGVSLVGEDDRRKGESLTEFRRGIVTGLEMNLSGDDGAPKISEDDVDDCVF